jgi:hypothetical protein
VQIEKLKEESGRIGLQLQDLQAAQDVEMTDYNHGGHSRHNPILIDLSNSKSLKILEARMDDIESNRGGWSTTLHISSSLHHNMMLNDSLRANK